MSTYCVIDLQTNLVINTIAWDGISDWTPPDGCIAVESSVAGKGWSYIDGEFHPPPVAAPTPEEILISQSFKLQSLTQLANSQKVALTNRISTLNDAIELEMATPEEEIELPKRVLQLKAWKTYAVLLGRVTSQAGWPPDVEWPVQPSEGMDLSVSATAPSNV